jgi:uncharacterized protein YqeY
MSDLRERLSTALTAAMRARDATAVSALRSALAALDNAGAVDAGAPGAPTVATHPRVAGTAVGIGAAEVERRELSDDEQRAVVQAEIDERLAAASQFDMGGHPERAVRLRAEAEALAACL